MNSSTLYTVRPNTLDEKKLINKLNRLITNWPNIDRERWALAFEPTDPFDGPSYGTQLRIASLVKAAKGYTNWLKHLKDSGQFDEFTVPEARISHAKSAGYFCALIARGNRPFTIVSRFSELGIALKILAPKADRSCVLPPTEPPCVSDS